MDKAFLKKNKYLKGITFKGAPNLNSVYLINLNWKIVIMFKKGQPYRLNNYFSGQHPIKANKQLEKRDKNEPHRLDKLKNSYYV